MANTSVVSSGGISVDTRDFARFAKALRKAEPALATKLRVNLREAGNIVADKARSNASWSSRIPGSVKVRTSSATVTVVAGGPKAPNAAPLEHGGRQGTFRHPVFGNRDNWVEQKARPFLKPAVDSSGKYATQAAVDALDEVVRQVAEES